VLGHGLPLWRRRFWGGWIWDAGVWDADDGRQVRAPLPRSRAPAPRTVFSNALLARFELAERGTRAPAGALMPWCSTRCAPLCAEPPAQDAPPTWPPAAFSHVPPVFLRRGFGQQNFSQRYHAVPVAAADKTDTKALEAGGEPSGCALPVACVHAVVRPPCLP
jgi:hypothetical protein